MAEKESVGRNDPCPCGSGRKYKACYLKKELPGKKKFSAVVLKNSTSQPLDLMERTFGDAIARTKGSTEYETIPSEEIPPDEVTEIEEGKIPL